MWSSVGTAYSRPSAVRTAKGTNGVISKCLRISPVITDRSYATPASQASIPHPPHPPQIYRFPADLLYGGQACSNGDRQRRDEARQPAKRKSFFSTRFVLLVWRHFSHASLSKFYRRRMDGGEIRQDPSECQPGGQPRSGGGVDRKSTRLNSSHIPLSRMP